MLAGLGERHPVQGGVELAVPGPAQAVAGLLLADQAGRGAVPLWRVYASLDRNLSMPAVLPRILAAVSGPQPGIAISAGARAVTRLVISAVSWSISAVSWRQRATSARASPATVPSSAEMRASTWSSTAPRSSDHARGSPKLRTRRVYSKDTQIRA